MFLLEVNYCLLSNKLKLTLKVLLYICLSQEAFSPKQLCGSSGVYPFECNICWSVVQEPHASSHSGQCSKTQISRYLARPSKSESQEMCPATAFKRAPGMIPLHAGNTAALLHSFQHGYMHCSVSSG